jgi:hypothetical protein
VGQLHRGERGKLPVDKDRAVATAANAQAWGDWRRQLWVEIDKRISEIIELRRRIQPAPSSQMRYGKSAEP